MVDPPFCCKRRRLIAVVFVGKSGGLEFAVLEEKRDNGVVVQKRAGV